MPDYYDRAGRPMTLEEWSRSYSKANQRVAETTLGNGIWISTVWLGLNHSFNDGPPLIFETLVFPSHGNMDELDGARYETEAEALEGHEAMVRKWEPRKAGDSDA